MANALEAFAASFDMDEIGAMYTLKIVDADIDEAFRSLVAVIMTYADEHKVEPEQVIEILSTLLKVVKNENENC